jgi:rhomboid protease GluP
MAFGLSRKFTQYYLLRDLSRSQFLVLAIESVKKQDWNISHTSQAGLIAHTKISLTSHGEEIKIKIKGNRAVIESESIDNQMINYVKNEGNVEAFMSTLQELVSTISAEELQQQYETIQPSLISKEQDVLSQPSSTTKEEIASFLSIFVPREGYYITPILISLNVVIFVLMVISGVGIMLPTSESLIAWGANFKPITLEGEWWRLITCCFVHIGILHLVMNMVALLYIGLLLEPFLGKTRFWCAYLLTGLASSLNSLWWHDLTVSAGASGAIFGMYGVFLALLSTNTIEKSVRKALFTSIGVFVVFNLMNGMKGGVDNAAHIGGLVSGLLIGLSYLPSLKKPDDAD